jgi:two-component system response regulator
MVKGSILVAEDNVDHAELIRRAIERVDCSCRTDVVRDGAEAIDYLFATGDYADRDPRQTPDLILLDLKMPKMGGLQVLQVLRRVRSRGSDRLPPVVVLTSSKQERDLISAYDLGAHSYIEKPTEFTDLVSAVRQVVEYWLGLNRSPPKRPHEAPGRLRRPKNGS